MQIKRTFAPTMREALAQVKREQGADAVILGNKKVPGGVEILSAIDFDESAVSSLAAQAPAPQMPAPATPAATSDVASDAWVDTLLHDGRREPTLGPVAANQRRVEAAPCTPAPAAHTPAPAPALKAVAPRKQVASKPAARAKARPRALPQSAPASPARRAQPARRQAPAQAARKAPAQAARKAPAQAARQAPRKAAVKPAVQKPMIIDQVRSELQNLRDLMESQLSVLQWDRFSQKHPVRTVLLNLMAEMGLGADVCETVLAHLDKLDDDPHKVWQQALGIIARCIPINRRDLLAEGGRIALVGSTGVGKTTTIAKLAARFAHLHGKRSVAMISTDQFRIGAQEQLQHFARLLEIPLLTAGNSEQLVDCLDMLADKKLVLIDTAGMSQRDLRLSEQFHRLQRGAPQIRPYLVLSANTQLAALNQTVQNFGKVKLAGAIVTKLDEAASLGGIITASIRHQLVLAYCGTGQKVPEDLEAAKSHRLVSRAVALMQQYGEAAEQESLALRYNHIINKNMARG